MLWMPFSFKKFPKQVLKYSVPLSVLKILILTWKLGFNGIKILENLCNIRFGFSLNKSNKVCYDHQ